MSRRRWFQMVVAAVIAVGVLVLSAAGQNDNALERVKEVQERHTERLMALPGVVGTAAGLDDQDRHAVVVLLEHPGVGNLPQQLEGVPVHRLVTGRISALKPPGKPTQPIDPTAYFPRPVPIGVSTGHPAITAGTIGCRVTDGANVYALSNNHVYANENRASLGDNVLQPGPYDGGGTVAGRDDVIGTLASYEPISFLAGASNKVDAATALSSTTKLGKRTPSNGYGTPKIATAAATVGLRVQKYGRTTGLTSGKVYAVNAIVNVGYDQGTARFVGQIVINPGGFSAGGDSGSLVVTSNRDQSQNAKPVGLLFAGSNTVTIANPIDAVLSSLGVTIDGE